MSKPAVAYIHGFGLKKGAIGSSVAHDSHNILAVGTNDIDILRAVNRIIKSRGGVVATSSVKQAFLPLPIAGLMSNLQGLKVYEAYSHVEQTAKEFGSTLTSPLMTLSFMALLVIPKLKLSDKGLFDSEKFQFIATE
jgi:adenine deaminase